MRRFWISLALLCLLGGCARQSNVLTITTSEALHAQALERVPETSDEHKKEQIAHLRDVFIYFNNARERGRIHTYDESRPGYDCFGGVFGREDGTLLIYSTNPEEGDWAKRLDQTGDASPTVIRCDYSLRELYETYAELHALMDRSDRAARCITDALPDFENNRIVIYVNQRQMSVSASLSKKLTHPERCVVAAGQLNLPRMERLDWDAYVEFRQGFNARLMESAKNRVPMDQGQRNLRLQRQLLTWLFYPPESPESQLLSPQQLQTDRDVLYALQYDFRFEPLYVRWGEEQEQILRRAFRGFEEIRYFASAEGHSDGSSASYAFGPSSLGWILVNGERLDDDERLYVWGSWLTFWHWINQHPNGLPYPSGYYTKAIYTRDETAHVMVCLVRRDPEPDGLRLADVLTLQNGEVTYAGTTEWRDDP